MLRQEAEWIELGIEHERVRVGGASDSSGIGGAGRARSRIDVTSFVRLARNAILESLLQLRMRGIEDTVSTSARLVRRAARVEENGSRGSSKDETRRTGWLSFIQFVVTHKSPPACSL